MDSIKTHSLVFSILLLFIAISCNNSIKKFDLSKYPISEYQKTSLIDLNKIKPLKKEWPELYQYLKKGHLQIITFKSGATNSIYSYQLYKFLNRNNLMIYKTPFLQDFDNVISSFGDSGEITYLNNTINVFYVPTIVGDICKTCTYSGFGYVFDKKTKKLLGKNGKINNINDWK